MIFVIAAGGLGNQLFIWNAGHYLIRKYNSPVTIIFNKNSYDRENGLQDLKKYCPHELHIKSVDFAFKSLVLIDRAGRRSPFLKRIVSRVIGLYETSIPSESLTKMKRRPRIVRGYFQDTDFVLENLNSYYEELSHQVHDELRSKVPLWDKSTGVALHIRRGDFVQNSEKVGLLSMEYFERLSLNEKNILICTDSQSDDPGIRKSFPDATIIGSDNSTTWLAFSILSTARKLVASNSTFSWWAGILCLHNGGEVIVPNPWTRTEIYGPKYLESSLFTSANSIFEEPFK